MTVGSPRGRSTDRVRVRVPATSANVGPGYDCLGLAVGRYDEVVARRSPDGPRIEVTGCGEDTVPRTPEHLVYRSALRGFAELGEPPVDLELLCRNEIPHGGGQGSSAAAIVAGLAVARALTPGGPERMSDRDLLDVAAAIEGHPDNAAPAVLGGFTLAWTMDGHTRVVRRRVHPDIRVMMFGAARGSSTEMARAILPEQVPHRDAADNTRAAALLVHAMSDDPSMLLPATEDRLHQQYRASVMSDTADLVGELRAAGIAAVVSGAGPSVLALLGPGTVAGFDIGRWRRPGFDPVELPLDDDGLRVDPIGP